MSLELNLLISLLKFTKDESVLIETINKEARLPSATTLKLLAKLQNENLVYLKEGTVEADSGGRLRLAIKAASLGGDVERISNLLCWQEFEAIAAFALKNNKFTVANNVRFKHAGRKWEIDVVGCKKPIVICVDCKHWQHGLSSSALRRIADSQVERTRALTDALPNLAIKLECTKWSSAQFTPAVLSLWPSAYKFYDEVPIVPVLQIQDFINQLPVYADSLKFFKKTFNSL
jgi:hypothetical protein